jgi:hypothetical protein
MSSNVDHYFNAAGAIPELINHYKINSVLANLDVPTATTILNLNPLQNGQYYHVNNLNVGIGGTISHNCDKHLKIIADGNVIADHAWTNTDPRSELKISGFVCRSLQIQASCSLLLNSYSTAAAEVFIYAK